MTPEQLLLIAQAKRKRAEAEAKAVGQPQPAAPMQQPPARMDEQTSRSVLAANGIDPSAVKDWYNGAENRDGQGAQIPSWQNRPMPVDPLAPKGPPKPQPKPPALWEAPVNVAKALVSPDEARARALVEPRIDGVGPRTPDPTRAPISEQQLNSQTYWNAEKPPEPMTNPIKRAAIGVTNILSDTGNMIMEGAEAIQAPRTYDPKDPMSRRLQGAPPPPVKPGPRIPMIYKPEAQNVDQAVADGIGIIGGLALPLGPVSNTLRAGGQALRSTNTIGRAAAAITPQGTSAADRAIRLAGRTVAMVPEAGATAFGAGLILGGENMGGDGDRLKSGVEFASMPENYLFQPAAMLLNRAAIFIKTAGQRVTPEVVQVQRAQEVLRRANASAAEQAAAARVIDELTPPNPQAGSPQAPAAPVTQASPQPSVAPVGPAEPNLPNGFFQSLPGDGYKHKAGYSPNVGVAVQNNTPTRTSTSYVTKDGGFGDARDLNYVDDTTLQDIWRPKSEDAKAEAIDLLNRMGNEADDASYKAMQDRLKRIVADDQAGTYAPQPAPAAPQATAPSRSTSAPVVPPNVAQGAPRTAQAGPAGAGQQATAGAGAAQPVLNATQVAPPVGPPGYTVPMAKSDAKIIGRILRDAGIPRNDVKPLLADTVTAYQRFVSQAHQSGEKVRLNLTFFAEDYLGQRLSPELAKNVQVKLRAFGNAANNSGDLAKAPVQRAAEELRGSQETYLTDIFERELGDESLRTTKNKIRGDKQLNAQAVYKTELTKGQKIIKEGKGTEAQNKAFDKLLGKMRQDEFFAKIPYELKVKAGNDPDVNGDLSEYVIDHPLEAAHWLQSNLGVLARKGGENAGAYREMRMALLRPLEDAVPGYRGARKRAGDLVGQEIAVNFGDDLFRKGRTEVQTAEMADDFKRLSPAQKVVAERSIRDKLKNEFRASREDAIDPVTGERVDSRGAMLTNLQKAGTLDALEQILGAKGKRIADGIRNIMRENPRIPSYGSDSAKNIAERRAIEDAMRSPVNKAIGAAGDKTGWVVPIVADAAMGTFPLATGARIGGEILERFGQPSRKQIASAAKTLYTLPPNPPTRPGAPPPPASGNRRPPPPRTGPRPPVTEADIEALRRQYDALDHGKAPKTSEQLARRIVNAEKRLAAQQASSAAPKQVKGSRTKASAPATAPTTPTKPKPPLPGQTSSSPPMIGGAALGALTSGGATYAATGDEDLALKAGILGGIGGGVLANRLAKGSTPKAPPAVKPKPAFDQRFMKEAQRLVSYNGGVDKALKAQQYVIDQLKNSKAPNAQDRLNRAVSIQYAIRRMAEKSNRELDEIVPMADAAPTGPKPIDPNTNYNIDPRGDKFVIRTDAGQEVLGAPQFADRKQALAWLQGETRKARQGGAAPMPRPGPPGVKPPPVKMGFGGGTPSKPKRAINEGFQQVEIDGATVNVTRTGNTVSINLIKVPEGSRGQGKASRAIDDVLNRADREGLTVVLTPDPLAGSTGLSKNQLEDFYRRRGFKPNAGRNKDFTVRETMIRQPRPTQNGFGSRDLPMDEASRMSRAREMGFDVDTVYYHGTMKDVDRFDPEKFGTNDYGWHGKGVYLATDPEWANTYSGMSKGFFEEGQRWRDKTVEHWNKTGKQPNVMPVYVRGKVARTTNTSARIEDYPDADALLVDYGNGHTEMVVRDPQNIRGKFAKFDPSESSSSKLLAGMSGNAEAIGAGTGAVLAPDADGDGEISFGERAGAAITGGVIGNVARRASGTGAPKVKPLMRGPDQAGLGSRPKPPAPRNAPPKGPPGTVSRMVAGGAVGGIAGGVAGEAGGQDAPLVNEFMAPLAQERDRIKKLEAELKILENGTVSEKQAYLAETRGLKISADGTPDGKLGPDTRAAIAKARTELEAAITVARGAEAAISGKAEKRRAEIEMKAAFDRTKPEGWVEMTRELGPWVGIGAGVLAGTLMRRGAVKKTAAESAKKAASLNKLVSGETPMAPVTVYSRKELGKRATNVNEFFYQGGAGKPDNLKQRLGMEPKKGVPLMPDDNGDWMASPNAKNAFDLFKPGTKHFKMMDVAVIGAAMAESEFAGNLAKGFHEEAKQAQAAVDKAQEEGNAANLEIAMARLESAKNAEAAAIAFQRFGQVAALARTAGAFKMPYEYTRPNVKKAQADQALILDAIRRAREAP